MPKIKLNNFKLNSIRHTISPYPEFDDDVKKLINEYDYYMPAQYK